MNFGKFQNDWRIKDRPWDYMNGVRLSHVRKYRPLKASWAHEHCTFCFAAISNESADLHSGYCTTDFEIDKQEWICENCFADFAPIFDWKVKSTSELNGRKFERIHFDKQKTACDYAQCALCAAQISDNDGTVNEAYFTHCEDENTVWICPECYSESIMK